MATLHLVGARNEPAPPPADERFDEPATLGEFLRRAREARGLTLDGLTRQTRIPRRHLEAIEGGSLTWVPEFYQRAEVRAIARAVGVGEQLALSRLQTAVRPVEAPADAAPAPPARGFSALYVSLALGAVVLASSLIAWGLFERSLTGGDVTGPRGTSSSQPPLQVTDDPASQGPGAPSDHALPPGADTALAPAPATTVLVVTTQPPGARVTVDGVGWGVSPIVIRHLPPGNKRIRVSMEGYAAAERMLALEGGEPRAVNVRLPRDGRTPDHAGPAALASGP